MFTGIVQSLGKVLKIQKSSVEGALTISLPKGWKIAEGSSVAVNGTCLSARSIKPGQAAFDCMAETFRRTSLGDLRAGDEVNLELPLTLGSLISGHLVQGHVDGVGVVRSIKIEGKSKVFEIAAQPEVCFYLLPKGSVALDGVSLTVVEVSAKSFSVALIPMTLRLSTLGRKTPGSRVNIELDLLAKMVYRFLENKSRVLS